jgi:hypothetical protein
MSECKDDYSTFSAGRYLKETQKLEPGYRDATIPEAKASSTFLNDWYERKFRG